MKRFLLALMVLGAFGCPPTLKAADDTPSDSAAPADTAATDSQDINDIREKADKGDADAEFHMGEAYRKGDGVPQDNASAKEWYEKSANHGNVDAQVAMGFIYRGGSGVPMDKVLSYMWFELASQHGDEHAFELRNDVAWSMTELQITEAKKKADQWKPAKAEQQ